MKIVLSLSLATGVSATGPIAKVLSLLEDLKAKAEAEGEVEADQFKAHQSWCAKTSQSLEFQIQSSKNDAESFTATKEEATGDATAAGGEMEEQVTMVNDNSDKVSKARAVRKAENGEHVKVLAELDSSIAMLRRAISILSRVGRGTPGASAAQVREALTQVAAGLAPVVSAAFLDTTKKQITSFLDDDLPGGVPEGAAYESHSTSIIDTLSDLLAKAESQKQSELKEEMSKKHSFQMLEQQYETTIETARKSAAEKKGAMHAAKEAAASAQSSFLSSDALFKQNSKDLGDVQKTCTTTEQMFQSRVAGRQDELTAISKAIEILSGDKFTSAMANRLPSQFMQIATKTRKDTREALSAFLLNAANRLHSVGLAQLAARTRSGGDPFGKVRQLISDMIDRLQKQGAEEGNHVANCRESKKQSEAKREKKSRRSNKVSVRLDQAKASLATLTEQVGDLKGEVSEGQGNMAELSSLRNNERATYKKAEEELQEGQTQLTAAVQVLQDFYASKSNLLQQSKPAFDGPLFSGEYKKGSDSAKGIIGLLEVTLSDISRQYSEAEQAEKQSESEFQKMSQEWKVSKASKESSIAAKTQEIASVKSALSQNSEDLTTVTKELDSIEKFLAELRKSCEYQPVSFEDRAKKREDEIASLQNALEILSQSFLQKGVIRRH